MYQTIFSNMFMLGFYLYFFNKFCANYLKTHFGKSILSIIYLTVMYKIISVDYIIKNLIIISFIGLISYENDYINNKIGYFDNNEKIKNIQKNFINVYDKFSVYLNYIFVFYDKIVEHLKKDYLKISGNISEFENNDNEEMEIMLNKMKEMLNDINMDMKNMDNNKKSNKKIDKYEKYEKNDEFHNDVSRIDDNVENKINNNINMEDFLNNIITEIQPLLNKEITDENNMLLNNISTENKEICEDQENIEDYIN